MTHPPMPLHPIFGDLIHHRFYHGGALPPLDKPYEYIVAANGVFIRATDDYVSTCFCVCPMPAPVRGLAPLTGFVSLKVPRIPLELLVPLLRHARSQPAAGGSLSESFYRIHRLAQGYRLTIPPQVGTSCRVTSAGDGGPDVILEIHTHGTASAYWSATDDADEQGFRFYAVLGRLHQPTPEMRLRLGVYGYWLPLPLRLLFTATTPDGACPVQDLEAAALTPLDWSRATDL